MTTDLSIYVNGIPLSHLGYWGDAVMTHRFPYGSWELSWSADYPLGYRHPALVQGALVVAKVGPCKVWRGRLTDPDFGTMSFTAEGTIRQAETSLAFNLSGATGDLDDAIFFAAARGALSFGTLTNFGPEMEDVGSSLVPYVMDLIAAYGSRNSTNLVVNPDGLLYAIGDPASPGIKVEPADGELGLVDDNYWTSLTGIYSPSAGTYALVTSIDNSQGAAWREGAIDLTALGVMTEAQAQSALDGILAQGLARTGWSDPVEVVNGQIVNMGGTSVEPWLIARSMATTGLMVRLTNMKDPRGVTLHTDVILEETVWNTTSDSIVLKPRGLTARDLSSVVESLGGTLAA